MSKISRIGLASILGVAMAVAALGCGTGANNDQGTSFLALGYFADSTGEIGLSGDTLPLFLDANGFDGLEYVAFMGLQNRMCRQFLRVDRIDCSYNVPGTNLIVPNDTFNFSSVIGPTPCVGVPQDPLAVEPLETNVVFAGFAMITPDIFAFLNVNQSRLPQLPFRMVVSCSATGVSQAGNTMTTNEVRFEVQWVDVAECCTGAAGEQPGISGGFQQGPGTGGGITFAGDDDDDGNGAAALEARFGMP